MHTDSIIRGAGSKLARWGQRGWGGGGGGGGRGGGSPCPFDTCFSTGWYRYAICSGTPNLCMKIKLSKRGTSKSAGPVAFATSATLLIHYNQSMDRVTCRG